MKNYELANKETIEAMQKIADVVCGIVGYEKNVKVIASEPSNTFYAQVAGKGGRLISISGLMNNEGTEKRIETVCHEFVHLLGKDNHTEHFYKQMKSIINRFNS